MINELCSFFHKNSNPGDVYTCKEEPKQKDLYMV